MSKRPKIMMDSPEAEAKSLAAALEDPDALPLTEIELAQFQPRRQRGRPALPSTKIATNLRLDPVIIGAFKSKGDGWQTRINDVLLEYVKKHGMAP